MAKGQIQKRGARRRQLKPVVLIVTEGSRTEPRYFNSFRNRRTNIDIHVVGGSVGRGTDYASLLKSAVDYMQKNGLSEKNGDVLWIVADADVNYNCPDPIATKSRQLETAKQTARKYGIRIALSNPCFELWFLLHFQYSAANLKDCAAVQVVLRDYLPDYDKAAEISSDLLEKLEQAICNANRLERYHVENGHGDLCDIEVNPCTGVHHLVESIR